MVSQKNKQWIFAVVFSILISLIVYRSIYPDDHSINANFFRDNPDFIYRKDGNWLLICRADYYSEDLNSLFVNPDDPFNKKKHWIKDAESRSILTWKISGKKYVIKRYNISGFRHCFKQLIPYSSSEALRAFYYSYLFDKIDINSAKAIAVLEKREGPFRTTSYQIMEHIKGMKGSDFFNDSKIPEIEHEKSIKETFAIAKKLEHANLIHGNLSLGHLFYVEGIPYLINLDSVRHYKSKSIFFKRRRQHKDLDILSDSFQEQLKKNQLSVNRETGRLSF